MNSHQPATLEQNEAIGSSLRRRPVVLSIAGFDPSSGAGVTADLKVFAAFGFYGMSCITGLTVQSTLGVHAVEPIAASTVAASLQMLSEDVTFSGIKLGMLATAEICEVVADFLESVPDIPVVLDPVLRSSSGHELLEPAGVRVLVERLLPRVSWITPNLDELSILTGSAVAARDEVPAAAEKLRQIAGGLGNHRLSILVTGGHLDPPDDYLLTDFSEICWISGERVETEATHGTGCALSSALLCRTLAGDPAAEAASTSKGYVTAALRAAYPLGRGKGPMHHLFALEENAGRAGRTMLAAPYRPGRHPTG